MLTNAKGRLLSDEARLWVNFLTKFLTTELYIAEHHIQVRKKSLIFLLLYDLSLIVMLKDNLMEEVAEQHNRHNKKDFFTTDDIFLIGIHFPL